MSAGVTISPELFRWLVTTMIGTREALIRTGKVRREVLDAHTAEVERQYDAALAQQASQDADAALAANPFLTTLGAFASVKCNCTAADIARPEDHAESCPVRALAQEPPCPSTSKR